MEGTLTQTPVKMRRVLAQPEAHETTNVPDNTERYGRFMRAFKNAMPYMADQERCLDNIWPNLSEEKSSDGTVYSAVGDDEIARLEAQYLDRMTVELQVVERRGIKVGPRNLLHIAARVSNSLQFSDALLEQRITAPTVEFSSDKVHDWLQTRSRDLYRAKGNEDVPCSERAYNGTVTYNLTEN